MHHPGNAGPERKTSSFRWSPSPRRQVGIHESVDLVPVDQDAAGDAQDDQRNPEDAANPEMNDSENAFEVHSQP